MIYIAVQLIQIFSAHGSSSQPRAGIRGGTRGPRGPKNHPVWTNSCLPAFSGSIYEWSTSGSTSPWLRVCWLPRPFSWLPSSTTSTRWQVSWNWIYFQIKCWHDHIVVILGHVMHIFYFSILWLLHLEVDHRNKHGSDSFEHYGWGQYLLWRNMYLLLRSIYMDIYMDISIISLILAEVITHFCRWVPS